MVLEGSDQGRECPDAGHNGLYISCRMGFLRSRIILIQSVLVLSKLVACRGIWKMQGFFFTPRIALRGGFDRISSHIYALASRRCLIWED